MLGRMLSAALVGGAGLYALAGGALAGTATIERPMFNGQRLDWCASWTDDCGKPAADAYCKSQGYAEATSFKREPHIGSSSPTRVISTGAICDFAHCDGFLEITCRKLPMVGPKEAVEAEAPAAESPEQKPAGGDGTAVAVDAAPVEADAKADLPDETSEEQSAPVQLASVDPTPPSAATAAVHPPTPPSKPVRVAVSARPGPVTKAFRAPSFKGKRLDWCRGWKDTCGQSTADDFCKFKGFARAVAFAPDPHIGRRQPTRQIATGMVCDQEMCDGFKIITCTR